MSHTRSWRYWAAAAVVLTAATVAGVAFAGTRLKGPTGLGVSVERDRIMGTTGSISAAGNKLRANVEVEFACPSGPLRYVHAFNAYTKKQWFDTFARKPKRFTFKNVVLATTEDLQQACLDGKKTYQAQVKTDMQCKGTVGSKWYSKTVKLPIKLSCKNVISPKARTARVSIKDYKHTCPRGYVFKETKKTKPIISRARTPRRCVRP